MSEQRDRLLKLQRRAWQIRGLLKTKHAICSRTTRASRPIRMANTSRSSLMGLKRLLCSPSGMSSRFTPLARGQGPNRRHLALRARCPSRISLKPRLEPSAPLLLFCGFRGPGFPCSGPSLGPGGGGCGLAHYPPWLKKRPCLWHGAAPCLWHGSRIDPSCLAADMYRPHKRTPEVA